MTFAIRNKKTKLFLDHHPRGPFCLERTPAASNAQRFDTLEAAKAVLETLPCPARREIVDISYALRWFIDGVGGHYFCEGADGAVPTKSYRFPSPQTARSRMSSFFFYSQDPASGSFTGYKVVRFTKKVKP